MGTDNKKLFTNRIAFFTLLSVMLTSCDCNYNVNGLILNSKTYRPVGDVQIRYKYDKESQSKISYHISNQEGKFHFSKVTMKCDPMWLSFSKEGYQTKSIEYESGTTDTLFLVPTEK